MNQKTAIGVSAGVIVVALFFWFGMLDSGSTSGSVTQDSTYQQSLLKERLKVNVPQDAFKEETPGLSVATAVIGQGEILASGNTAAVHYIGRFSDGIQFDSSVDRGEPLVFEFGAGQLISGFERGMSGMRLGEIRRIVVSPEFAYGAEGIVLSDGTVIIPPNATLIFDIYLVNISENVEE